MKDVNFNYYLSKKEDVVKMLKSYLDAKKDIAQCKELYENKIREIEDSISIEENIKCKIEDDRNKEIYSLINQENSVLKRAKELKERNIEKKIRIITDVILIAIIIIGAMWIKRRNIYIEIYPFEMDCSHVWIVISSIIMLGVKIFAKNSYVLNNFSEECKRELRDEYDRKMNDTCKMVRESFSKKEYPVEYHEACRKKQELEEQKSVLKNKLNELNENNNSLVEKFNIPKEIRDCEEVVYNLLINNRVGSFNEALDKIEVYKHRKYLEEMQLEQCNETANLKYHLEKELNDINDKFDNNKKLINEIKDLASKAADAASSASSEASRAAARAEDAAYYARR